MKKLTVLLPGAPEPNRSRESVRLFDYQGNPLSIPANPVQSTDVDTIVLMSQNDYDALVSPDASTLYMISSS